MPTPAAGWVASLVAHEPGTGWLADEVGRFVHRHGAERVLVDPRTPASTALNGLRDLEDTTVTEVTTLDVTQAFVAFCAACTEGTLRHIGQAEMASALTGAVRRPVGDAFAWSRRSSSVDIWPICAASLAVWGVGAFRNARNPQVIALNTIAYDPEEDDRYREWWFATDEDEDPYAIPAPSADPYV